MPYVNFITCYSQLISTTLKHIQLFTPFYRWGIWGLCMHSSVLSHVQGFVTERTVAHQAPLSIKFSRQEYWSRLPFPSPGDVPDPGIEPTSRALAGGFFTTAQPGKSLWDLEKLNNSPNYMLSRNGNICVLLSS